MRPQVVLILLLVVIVVLGGLALTRRHPAAPSLVTVATPASPASIPAPTTREPIKPVTTTIATAPQTPQEHQAAVDVEVDRLHDLTGKTDAASLSVIMTDLTSPDKEVRLTAIEAVKQSDDTNIIPILKADAASATDSDTQIALLEAADFLSLPDAVIGGPGNGTPQTPEQIQAVQQKMTALRTQPPAQNRGHGTTAPATPAN